MQETLLEEYATIRAQMKSLEAIESALRREIFITMKDAGVDNIERSFGRFVVSKGRPKWEYSPALERRIENIMIAKVREQEKGVAKEIPGDPHLRFAVPSDKDTQI